DRAHQLVAPGAEAGDAGRAGVAAHAPVHRRAGAVGVPAGAAAAGEGDLGDVLAVGGAFALGGAGLEARAQVRADVPVHVEGGVAGLGAGLAVDHVVHRVVAVRVAGVAGLGQHAVAHHVARLRRLRAGEVAAPEHEVAVVVVRVHVRAEGAHAQGEVVGRLELDIDQSALALARLLEQGRARQALGPAPDRGGVDRAHRR